MQIKNVKKIALGTLALFLIPLIAMQFVDGMVWTLSDFVIMGLLIFMVGLLLDWAMRKEGRARVFTVAVIILLFLWLWAELAVGIFTNWGS